MTLSELKVKWLRSKIDPVLFYLPVTKKNKKRKSGVVSVTFTPLTAIYEQWVTISPRVPMEQFFIVGESRNRIYEDDKSFKDIYHETGRLRDTRLWGRVNVPKPYGCSYLIYKEVELETGEIYWIPIDENGDLVYKKFEKPFNNTKTFLMEPGRYIYLEYASSEGDCLFWEPLEITVTTEPTKEAGVIKDYDDSEQIENTQETEKNKDLYIQYINQRFEDENGQKYKHEAKNTLTYEIFHEPKLIKTYTTFKWVNEPMPEISEDGIYLYHNHMTISWQSVPPGGFFDTGRNKDGTYKYGNSHESFVSANLQKLVPVVNRVTFMGKDIGNVDNEGKISRSDTTGHIVAGYYGDVSTSSGVFSNYGKLYNLEYNKNFAHQAITIENVLVCNSYFAIYNNFRRNYSIALDDFDENGEYMQNPYLEVASIQDNGTNRTIDSLAELVIDAPTTYGDYFYVNVGANLACEGDIIEYNEYNQPKKDKDGNIVTHKGIRAEGTVNTETPPGATKEDEDLYGGTVKNIIIRTQDINKGDLGSFAGMRIKSALTTNHVSAHFSEDTGNYISQFKISKSEYDDLENDSAEWNYTFEYKDDSKTTLIDKGEEITGYVCEEDVAHFAVFCADAISAKDPENDPWSCYPGGSTTAFYRMALYEDDKGKTKYVGVETFTLDQPMTVQYSTISYKLDDLAVHHYHSYPVTLPESVTTACGASVVFTRTTRWGYSQYHFGTNYDIYNEIFLGHKILPSTIKVYGIDCGEQVEDAW